MAVVDPGPRVGVFDRLRQRSADLIASPRFQSWAARFPLTKAMARRDGERLFDLVAGFTYTQTLQAMVSLGLPDRLASGPKSVPALALETGLSDEAMRRLCQACTALDLLARDGRTGAYRLARLGNALRGVPGLQDMILHHDILYRDLAQPEVFLRGDTTPELAAFWPYVFGAGAAQDPAVAQRYSRLMADTQALVAEETLKSVSFGQSRVLLDIGGGSGAFLRAVLDQHKHLTGMLFDLPGIPAPSHPRMTQHPGNFRTDMLPEGADSVSLIRVLYDHQDDTVCPLLEKVYSVLPTGGRLILSEPMSGGAQPTRTGDVYFALYCMAMGTGCVRDPERIAEMLRSAGFAEISIPKMDRPFVTQAITARKT